MVAHDHLQQAIAISHAKGMHAHTLREILERVGTLDVFFSLSQAELNRLVGVSSDIFSDSYREALLSEAEKEAEFVRRSHIDTFFIGDENYPRRLVDCEDAPLLLYRVGSCDLDMAHTVGIVGTRSASSYGIGFTTNLVEELAKKVDNLVIISGLAYGVDVAAHMASLAQGVPTIGVLAHGLNTIYPADHRSVAAKMASSGGALVTEYCSNSRIHRSNFLARNRIVAGLCDALVIVESDYKGGSMSTARISMNYNREVFALPGRVNDPKSRGTNHLIANHTASLITCADDLIEQMGWENRPIEENESPQLFRAFTKEEQELIDFITAHPEASINDLCVKLSKSYSIVSDMLFKLELDDFITMLPGGRMSINSY